MPLLTPWLNRSCYFIRAEDARQLVDCIDNINADPELLDTSGLPDQSPTASVAIPHEPAVSLKSRSRISNQQLSIEPDHPLSLLAKA
jgi:hypothetical protein